jgi:dextranase
MKAIKPGRCERGTEPEILDLYCDRAQYRPGEAVVLVLEVDSHRTDEVSVRGVIELWRLGVRVDEVEFERRITPGMQSLIVRLDPRNEGSAAFGVDLTLAGPHGAPLRASTAFDVAADPGARIRYGFLSDFAATELGRNADVELLAKLHVNYLQFYDWMYRHDSLVPSTRHYTDPMGKESDLEVVRGKIDACHAAGIRAIAYGAVYAATAEFFEKHREWGLYHRDGTPYCFIDRFYIMDITRDSPWSAHIVGQFREVVERLGFDGIHMDTYGFPKRAFSYPGGAPREGRGGRVVDLGSEFPYLIAQTRAALGANRTLIFNNVGGWPIETTAGAPQDAVYVEVWKPFDRYHHLADLVSAAKRLGGGKPVILAAYIEPFDSTDSEESLSGAEQAALLATAVITSSGGYHLLLGEEGGLLMRAYYVDHATARPSFLRRLRNYYDFIVRYTEIFFDKDLIDVTTSHFGVEFPEYAVQGAPTTQTGEAGRVWVTIRESPARKVLTFVNLVGLTDDRWNIGQKVPKALFDLRVEARVMSDVTTVYAASPDLDGSRPLPLAFSLNADFAYSTSADPTLPETETDKAEIVTTTLPELRAWAILIIELVS